MFGLLRGRSWGTDHVNAGLAVTVHALDASAEALVLRGFHRLPAARQSRCNRLAREARRVFCAAKMLSIHTSGLTLNLLCVDVCCHYKSLHAHLDTLTLVEQWCHISLALPGFCREAGLAGRGPPAASCSRPGGAVRF